MSRGKRANCSSKQLGHVARRRLGLSLVSDLKKRGPPQKLKQNKMNLEGGVRGCGGGPLQVHFILLQFWGGPRFILDPILRLLYTRAGSGRTDGRTLERPDSRALICHLCTA